MIHTNISLLVVPTIAPIPILNKIPIGNNILK